MTTATVCPPQHTAYPSREVAQNAVTLHRWAFPNCPGFETWECGDHHHVGHPAPSDGYRCKTDPEHLAQAQRLHGRWH